MEAAPELLGHSPAIEALRQQMRRLAAARPGEQRLPTVLITGETGTGKSLVARCLHQSSPRATGPFVDVNCAAIPDTLLEAELFGYERGAFTDARRPKPGLFQVARGGTLFLDEIGLLSPALQAKLLSALQERSVRRLGATRPEPVDVWVIAATNEDLTEALRAKRFREDLYHRLAVVTLAVPALRARGSDVVPLAEHFVRRTCADYGLPAKSLTEDARSALTAHPWPGNVRELSNAIERAVLLTEADNLSAATLALSISAEAPDGAEDAAAPTPVGPERQAMRERLERALAQARWNISRTAATLGISRNTVYARMRSLGLRPDPGRDRAGAPAAVVAAPEASRPSPGPPEAPPPASAPARTLSIAVLPLANLSNDPEQEYLADGITEDLITALSRLRWLTVIARNSSFHYKGRADDVRDVGKALGAGYVVGGSVRKSGDRVRVSCHLVDASTGSQVWAERYDRQLVQTFELEDEITFTIAGAIEPELSRAEQDRAHRKPVESLDAWELFHRGLWHLWKYTRDSHAEARRLFQAAVGVDPQFAAAHSYLALNYLSSFLNGLDDSEDLFVRARDTALRALAIDDKDAVARFVLGRVYTQLGQVQAGLDELQESVRLNPSFAQAYMGLGIAYLILGRWEEARDACATGARLSPHDPMMTVLQSTGAAALALGGRLDEAAALARTATAHPGSNFWSFAGLASILGHLGRTEEARAAVAKLLEMRPDFSEATHARFFRADSKGAPQRFWFDGLYKAGLPRPPDGGAGS